MIKAHMSYIICLSRPVHMCNMRGAKIPPPHISEPLPFCFPTVSKLHYFFNLQRRPPKNVYLLSICTEILEILDILQFEMSSWRFFLD